MRIEDKIKSIKENLPPNVKLVAVSKFMPVETIMEAYNAGLKDFGESRPQELKAKMEILPDDIRWHFIGHLQSNKIKMILDRVHLIHSVDSQSLLSNINREASKRGIKVKCLLQLYIATEDSKQGLSKEELTQISIKKEDYSNIIFCGLMGMASFTDEYTIIKKEFNHLKTTFDYLKENFFKESESFNEISMGMSGDYMLAIEEGSTIVRIGSNIFGNR